MYLYILQPLDFLRGEAKLDGFSDVVHQFFLCTALRDGLWQLLALTTIESRYGVMLNNNGVFCHIIFVLLE